MRVQHANLLTANEVRQVFDVSYTTALKWMKEGEIERVTVGGKHWARLTEIAEIVGIDPTVLSDRIEIMRAEREEGHKIISPGNQCPECEKTGMWDGLYEFGEHGAYRCVNREEPCFGKRWRPKVIHEMLPDATDYALKGRVDYERPRQVDQ